MFLISRKDDPSRSAQVDAAGLEDACERLSEGRRYALDVRPVLAAAPVVANSQIGGPLVTDEAARTRITAQHSALITAGVKLDASRQFFVTGTRMADAGYATQAARTAEHAAKAPIADVARALLGIVRDEKREDLTVTAGEFGAGLHVNGRISFDGLAISEQAIRGIAARLESPMLGYVLGLRDRCAASSKANHAAREAGQIVAADRFADEARHDRSAIASVLSHECKRASDTPLKLRARRGPGDIFAAVGPGYVSADAPDVLDDLIAGLPRDARGTFSYDPTSTAWELRASVWTPTPVNEQAVGEAFEGYASFQSRDNGTSRFRGGGGVTLLRCLNASTYTADGIEVSRVHRGRVRADIDRMLRGALTAVDALCQAWGTNRATPIAVPNGVRLEDAIPGFWRFCLQDKRSALLGVLPGRSEAHVKGLTEAFYAERRDPGKLVRSDLAQGWTRYVQGQPTTIRRNAEAAIGDWLVDGRPVGCDLRD